MRPRLLAHLCLLVPAISVADTSSTLTSTTTQIEQVTEVGSTAPLQAPPREDSRSASSTKALSQPSNVSALSQPAAAGGINFSPLITFDEFPLGSLIASDYKEAGIILGGSELKIINDIASTSSPVLGGTPPGGEIFEGDITGQFVIPGTTIPAPVYRMAWKIGGFDSVGSVEMQFFGPQGQLLFSLTNPELGFSAYSARGGSVGIASWRFHIVSIEPAGFGIDNLYFSIPGQDDIDREKGEVDCAQGNPVNPAVGNKFQLETDYQGSRTFPLTVSRAYNSIDGDWQLFPQVNFVPGEVASQIVRPDGKGLTYLPHSGTQWRPSSTDITGILVLIVDENGVSAGWRYTTLDDQVEIYDTSGRLSSVTQRSGIRHDYSYSPTEITVTHSFGGSLRYLLDEVGVITGFTDPDGNLYSYTYGANSLISSVSYPTGGGRSYHYDDANNSDLLTGISDANGNRFATWAYDSDRRALSSQHSNGAERVTFDYSLANDPSVPRTTVTNALGKSTTYHYLTVNGAKKVFHVSGHASANCVASNQDYGFDSNAFVASKTDWKGTITSYVRNDKGQILSRTEAQGSAQERTTTTEWHPNFNLPVKIIEPGMESQFTYDTNGNLLNRSDSDTSQP